MLEIINYLIRINSQAIQEKQGLHILLPLNNVIYFMIRKTKTLT